jgi:hypothetical protein
MAHYQCALEPVLRYKRAHVLLPEDLVREIDAIAGRRGRSAFLVKTAEDAVRRTKLLQILDSDKPIWKDEDHPELAKGSANWVRNFYASSSTRLSRAQVVISKGNGHERVERWQFGLCRRRSGHSQLMRARH